jgi:catechol 2,3-dioxygenase-like lactoylglutathione lyase family enzyme
VTLKPAIPALPCRDVAAAVVAYRERFGFEALHHDGGFAVLQRDAARIHLWESGDESWREREDLREWPVRSGAESFLSGTASCRIEVDDVDALFAELSETGVLHYSVRAVQTTEFGTREFATSDLDNNLLEFFSWVASSS